MSALAIIPARGGSRGIPRKNLAIVGGQPLVARTVAAACGAARIGLVIVSTDDDDIASIAVATGAEVVRRPTELSGDTASSESAVLHVLDHLRVKGIEFDVVAMLQCTSPFTVAADVDGTIACLDDTAVDCAFTAVRSHAFLWRTGDGEHGVVAVNHDPSARPRRQDRAPEFAETGAVYAMRTSGLRTAAHRFFGRVTLYEVPADRALEVDEPDDLVLANAIAGAPASTDRARA